MEVDFHARCVDTDDDGWLFANIIIATNFLLLSCFSPRAAAAVAEESDHMMNVGRLYIGFGSATWHAWFAFCINRSFRQLFREERKMRFPPFCVLIPTYGRDLPLSPPKRFTRLLLLLYRGAVVYYFMRRRR